MSPTPLAEVFRLRALELRELEDEFLATARTTVSLDQKAEWLRQAHLLNDAASALEALIEALTSS